MKTIRRSFTKTLQERLKERLNFIQAVIGPRQVGKTTGVTQILENWQGPSLMVTADEVAAPDSQWLALHFERARQKGENVLFIVDEIQKIPEWSTTLKFLFDKVRSKRTMKVVILGSASLAIQRGLGDSLAGRYELIPAHHWNLNECQEAFNWKLEDFLKFGGYPASAELTDNIPRWQSFIRNSIIEPVLMKDIIGQNSLTKPALFRQCFELAMSYPAQEISLQKMLGQLQDNGNVTTIKHYLHLLSGAFLLKSLQKYTGSEIRTKGSSPKLLPLNTALVNAFRSPEDLDQDPRWYGRIFETAVGSALSRSQGHLYYWRQGKFEVDFILKLQNKVFAIEVKSGGIKNTKGLQKFLSLYKNSIPIIVDHSNVEILLRAETVDVKVLQSL